VANWLKIAMIVLLVANFGLLFSGYRLLIGERVVQPGEHFIADQWGDLGKNDQASIVCKYWTGRSVKLIVWWYPSGFAAKDECPFLLKVSRTTNGGIQ
jgi:hypothetical protein